MNARFSPFLSAIALAALAFLLTPSFSQAEIITLTGGDAADASDGIGYAPSGTPIEAYRITTTSDNFPAGDPSAHTYKGITFQPFFLNGGSIHSDSSYAVTTQGTPPLTATTVNGFFYQLGASNSMLSGSGEDIDLYNVAKYMSNATNGSYHAPGGTETLTLSGLSSGSTYQIDLFVGDSYNGDTSTYNYTMTGAGGALPTEGLDTSRVVGNVYDVRDYVVATSGGIITVDATTVSDTGDAAAIYAFSVELVPEPASMSLLAAGSLMMLRRRRAQV